MFLDVLQTDKVYLQVEVDSREPPITRGIFARLFFKMKTFWRQIFYEGNTRHLHYKGKFYQRTGFSIIHNLSWA